DRAVGEMRSRNMTHVRFAWLVGEDGGVQWLVIEPSASGLKIRYSNRGLKPHIHVPTVDVGKATYVVGGSDDCPEERIDGDEFAFRVPDSLSFDVAKPDEKLVREEDAAKTDEKLVREEESDQ